jgi:YfiH family protein
MSGAAAERSAALSELGIDHGFALSPQDLPGLWRAQQVHGAALVEAPGIAPGTRADALFSTQPGCAVGIHTADCVPLLLVRRDGRAVAAVHAGWRGSAARIALRCVQQLCERLGGAPRDWLAAIGPHIGPCCYEVDEPVRAAIEQPDAFAPAAREGHFMLDLERVARAQLAQAGLAAHDVSRVGGCTRCDPRHYPSHRRDGSGERMLHYVRVGY